MTDGLKWQDQSNVAKDTCFTLYMTSINYQNFRIITNIKYEMALQELPDGSAVGSG